MKELETNIRKCSKDIGEISMSNRWKEYKFSDAPVEIIDGDRGKNYPKKNEFFEEGYCLFLNANNVTKEGFSFNSMQFITRKKDELLRSGKIRRGDIVFTTRGTIGNVAYYNDNVPFEHVRINSGMVIFRCNQDKIRPDFLFQFMRSPFFYAQINALKSGVAQPQLPICDIKYMTISIPSLIEQRKISSILSAYDDLIENNTRRIQILEEIAQMIYKEWFVNFEFPTSPSPPPPPPDKGELKGVGGELKGVKGELKGVGYIPYNPKLKEYARQNRKNPTPAEKKMWELLCRKQFDGLKFTRQKPLEDFIVDFYCSELLLGIEIDGDTHAFQEKYDELRSDILQKRYGIEIIRYQNSDVLSNTEGVYLDLTERIKSRKKTHPKPTLTLPYQGGNGMGYKSAGGKFVDSELGKIPEGWEVKSIMESTGWSFINENVPEYNGEKEYFATANIEGIDIAKEGILVFYNRRPSRAQKQPGLFSVWFARMRDTYKVLGFTKVNEDIANKSILSSGFAGFKTSELLFPFIFLTIKSEEFHQKKNQFCTGATQMALTNEGLEKIKIIVPNKNIIEDFGKIMLPLLDKIFVMQKKNKILRQTRDLLLPKLISGELDVSDMDIKKREEIRNE